MSSSSEPEIPKKRDRKRRRKVSSSSESDSDSDSDSDSSSSSSSNQQKQQKPGDIQSTAETVPTLGDEIEVEGGLEASEDEQPTEKASFKKKESHSPLRAKTGYAWKTKKLIEDAETGIEILVSDPQQRSKSLGKKFIVYHITGKDDKGTIEVFRRFNEFNELRIKLTENWPGIFIPPMPEKKAVGNLDKNFIEERQRMLDKFLKRCSVLPHIFYSNEMQVFLRTSNQVTKVLSNIKVDRPSVMLKRYEQYFSKFAEDTGDKTEASVNKYFTNLDKTINFFKDYRNEAKRLRTLKKQYKVTYLKFLHYTVIDYKNKLRKKEKEGLDRRHKAYVEEEKQDDLEEFLQNLKELLAELYAFDRIKNDLTSIRKQTEAMRELQTKHNNDLSKVRGQDGTVVKKGMFKKIAKADLIKEYEQKIEDTTEDLNALMQLRSIVFNLLNFQEFPRLIDVKRRTFAVGLVNYANMREGVISQEAELLKSIQAHYDAYLKF